LGAINDTSYSSRKFTWGYVVLDQIRTINKSRLVQLLGKIDKNSGLQILEILQEMFAA